MDPTQSQIDAAVQHLQAMLDAMYEGRSVRTPAEFKADLAALHTAIEALGRTGKAQP
jgi:hypothetical protein